MFSSCSSPSTLEQFNEALDQEQTEAFDAAVDSFIQFLALNYPEKNSLSEQNQEFLKEVKTNSLSNKWIRPKDLSSVKELWEKSGLRKEIRQWPQEYENSIKEDIEPIIFEEFENDKFKTDSSYKFNMAGNYIAGLLTCSAQDSFVSSYIEAKSAAGDISPSLVANAFLAQNHRYDAPLLLRMEIAEFYFFIFDSEFEKPEN